MTPKHIVIAGETYSTNLGDGVIYQTLSYLFTKADPSIQISPLDISGRQTWMDSPNIKDTPSSGRSNSSKAGGQALRNLFRANQPWAALLNGTELLVIGGGKLLIDHRLNFPVKLTNVVRASTKFGLPIHFSAVGVGQKWSRVGGWMFKRILSQAETISLRDVQAQKRLEKHIPGIESSVTFDPGIWAADVYGPKISASDEQIIGLGVIHTRDVNFYRPKQAALSEANLLDSWLGIIRVLDRKGIKFEIFTNGNSEDYQFALNLSKTIQTKLSIPSKIADRPTKPVDLARTISKYSGVIASRLHANIIATSYQIPSVGLVWDEKIRAFYKSTERPRNVFPVTGFNSEDLVEALLGTMRDGVKTAVLERDKKLALLSVEMVLQDT